MKVHVRFLGSLAHAFSTMSLYGSGHPARQKAIQESYQELTALLAANPNPVFSFLDGEVVYGDKPVKELGRWGMGARLAKVGVQRLEFRVGASNQELEDFLEHLMARVSFDHDPMESAPVPLPHIRFGSIKFGAEDADEETVLELPENQDSVDLLHQMAVEDGRLSPEVAAAVVEAISVTMHQGRRLIVRLMPLKDHDQYSAVHSLNTSALSMALAEFLELGSEDVRLIGEAALLHDVGKVFVPKDILNKPGKLSQEEWAIVKRHTVDGAKILLRSSTRFTLAATAAYEHHISWNGGGYPDLHFTREPHRVSRLIQICDVYDACRTRRPFRGPVPSETILENLRQGAGQEFDPLLVRAFVGMIHKWEARLGNAGSNGARQTQEASGTVTDSPSADTTQID